LFDYPEGNDDAEYDEGGDYSGIEDEKSE